MFLINFHSTITFFNNTIFFYILVLNDNENSPSKEENYTEETRAWDNKIEGFSATLKTQINLLLTSQDIRGESIKAPFYIQSRVDLVCKNNMFGYPRMMMKIFPRTTQFSPWIFSLSVQWNFTTLKTACVFKVIACLTSRRKKRKMCWLCNQFVWEHFHYARHESAGRIFHGTSIKLVRVTKTNQLKLI